jgi:hypothetical protein
VDVCVFCAIVAGTRSAHLVHQTPAVIAFLDQFRQPAALRFCMRSQPSSAGPSCGPAVPAVRAVDDETHRRVPREREGGARGLAPYTYISHSSMLTWECVRGAGFDVHTYEVNEEITFSRLAGLGYELGRPLRTPLRIASAFVNASVSRSPR